MTKCPECNGTLASVGGHMCKGNISYRRKECRCGYGISEWSDGRIKVRNRGPAKKGPDIESEITQSVERVIRENPDCTMVMIREITGFSAGRVEQAIRTLTPLVGIYESDGRPIRYGIDDEIFGTISGIDDIHIGALRSRC